MTKPKSIFFSLMLLSIASFHQAAAETRLEGAAAFGDWRADAPGVVRKVTPADLPKPFATKGVDVSSAVIPPPAGATLKTPPGFKAELVISGLKEPRVMRVAPNGDVFVAEAEGRISVLRFAKGENAPTRHEIFVSGLDAPYGLAFYPPGQKPQFLYVATPTQVLRYPYHDGDLRPFGGAEIVVQKLASSGGHWTRDLAFSPDGATLYVSIGSKTNDADGHANLSRAEIVTLEETEGVGASGGPEKGRALVLAFNPLGGERRVYATGLRNCSGLTIRPASDELWCVVNERDMLGDDLPPDYATHVVAKGFYGWPWYYIGANEDPRHWGERPDLKDKVITPDVLIEAHSAPLGISFYDAAQFPSDYKGDAFVALHGSWNRAKLTGYKVVRLRFKDGKPTGEYEDFVTGFVTDDRHVWGRPVDVIVAPDGSLLFSEDGNGTIWRVSYTAGK